MGVFTLHGAIYNTDCPITVTVNKGTHRPHTGVVSPDLGSFLGFALMLAFRPA